ncbi:5082_t:CDS:1 [Dentiscutata heterogama]|uniref:5082_t:CDS:1 n=1 Tax=Dentiscutata heterogama TaxID=1316150 RepID=A0ACA9LV82_9GLOM|nr:5082_t:CDS:1 [Dentiscutata heterogama]
MPPRRTKSHSKASNSSSSKNKKMRTIYYQDTEPNIFTHTIYGSFLVKANETGTKFSAFIKLSPIQDTINKTYRDKYVKWHLISVKSIFKPAFEINGTDKKICSLYSVLNREESTKISFSRLLACSEVKEHKTYFDAEQKYAARLSEEAPWSSTRSMPSSVATLWFFGNVSDFTKNEVIGKVVFKSNIQYKELAVEPVDSIESGDQYQSFGNGELELEQTEIFDEYLVKRLI